MKAAYVSCYMYEAFLRMIFTGANLGHQPADTSPLGNLTSLTDLILSRAFIRGHSVWVLEPVEEHEEAGSES